jgi:hypothetical protein
MRRPLKHGSKWTATREAGIALLPFMMVLLITGCVLTPQSKTGDPSKQPGAGGLIKPYISKPQTQPESTPGIESPQAGQPHPMEPAGTDSQGSRAPAIPRTVPNSDLTKPTLSNPPTQGNQRLTKPTRANLPTQGKPNLTRPTLQQKSVQTKPRTEVWEDQKVRQKALEMARKRPSVKKIKICYAVKDDEWWVILYEDAGSSYELLQYTWNRDQDKLEQFLVLKRISRNRLKEHLALREPDRACDILDPGPIPPAKAGNPGTF